MIEIMGRSPAEYGFYFALVPSGYILGNFMTARFAVAVGANRMLLTGMIIGLAGIGSMAAAFAAGFIHPISLFGPMFLIGIANGLVLPNGIAGAVSVKPDAAGAAAGLSGSFQIGFGALVAPLVGTLLSTTVWPLIAVMTICAVLGLAAFGLVVKSSGTSSAS